MKHFGNTMVVWDLKAMKPKQVFDVPGAPLEIRWSLNAGDNWAITATALTSKLWLVKQDGKGGWQAKEVGDDRRPGEDPAAGRHHHHRRRQGPVGQHLHGRQDALLRPDQPGAAEADLREGDRQAGQHGLAELGRQARLHHLARCSPTGTRRARTTSSSCAPSTGTARSSSRPSRSTSPRRSSAARTT